MLDKVKDSLAAHPPASKLQVAVLPISQLRLDPANPRTHSRRQIQQIAKSIISFGFNVPILIDREQRIASGHGRLLAAQELGWTEIPTISLEHLNEAQKRAFMIADNRLNEISTFNDHLLAKQLRGLSALNLNFSLEATGFEMAEIDLRIEGLTSESELEDTADRLPDPVSGQPVCKLGDLWLLGHHRVLCGNALEHAAYAELMAGEQAAMVFADPPYNVRIPGHVSGNGAVKHRNFVMASGEQSLTEFTEFLSRSSTLMAQHTAKGAIIYQCMDWRHVGEILTAAKSAKLEHLNIC